MNGGRADEPSTSSDWRSVAIVALLAIASSSAGLLNDFVYDDVPLIRDNVRVHGLSKIVEIVSRPYWPPPFVEQLYRPFPVLLFAVEYTIGGGSPIVFRIVSYLLYAASTVLVLHLARRVLPERTAFVAAAFFAVHPVHVEAVALGVNQADVLIGIFAALIAIRYIDARRAGGLGVRDWAALVGVYVAAMLTKESGFVLILLPLVAEVLVVPERTATATTAATFRVKALWIGYASLAVSSLAVIGLRAIILAGRPLQVVTTRLLAGLSTGQRMLTMLQVVPTWFRLLLWPQHLEADYAVIGVNAPGFGARELLGVALVVAMLVLMCAARRKSPALGFGVAWCAIGLLPVSNIVPTGVLLAERTLFLPSVGAMIAVGACGEWILERWPSPKLRDVLTVLCVIIACLGLARSAARHRAWNSAHVTIVPRAPLAPR